MGRFQLFSRTALLQEGALLQDVAKALPLTSVQLRAVDPATESLALLLTTFGHGLFATSIDIPAGHVSTTQLPAPPLAFTCVTTLRTSEPFHVTASALAQAIPAVETVVAARADGTLMA